MSRLRLSWHAKLIAENAMNLVATQSPEVDDPVAAADLVADARELAERAEELLKYAVVHARMTDATWDAIGEQLGRARQNTTRTYAGTEAAWRRAATEPNGLPRFPAYPDPGELASELDAWAYAHHLRDYPDDRDPYSVSRGLRRVTPAEELAVLQEAARHALTTYTLSLDELAQLRAREADLLQLLADEDGPDSERHRTDAAAARAQADEFARLLVRGGGEAAAAGAGDHVSEAAS